MLKHLISLSLLAIGATVAAPAIAVRGEIVDTCIELGADHALRRNGSQFLYISDGEQRYRLSFKGGVCGEIALTSQLRLDTDGSANRICPENSRVIARKGSCRISKIERIDEEDFRRLTRPRR